ncbi:MAG: DUF4340 domain-containing protein [Ruminococcus sp.]|nr:DUF4340 domain-containing protein [Ruminococcus sp.]
MKKVIIAMVALLVVAGGSFGAFLAVKNKSDKETEKQVSELAENDLFSFDSETVTEISFDCPDGHYKVIHEDDNWKLDTNEFVVDQDYIDTLLYLVSDFTAETNYGVPDDNKKSMYGLDNPAETITISDGEETYKIYVGNITPTNDYYYFMVEGKDKVYTINSIQGSVLKASRMMLKAKDLIPYDSTGIKQITVKKDGVITYDITYDTETSTWSLPEEYSELPFDQTAVGSMLTTLTRLESEQLLEEYLEDMSKYGFDKPTAEVTIKGTDGTQKDFIIGGQGDNNQTYIYVLMKDSNQVARFYTSDLNFINYKPLNFLPDSVTSAGIYNINGFDFIFGDVQDSFTLNMTDRILEMNGTAVDMENSEIYTGFQNFYNSFSTIIFTDTDIEATPDNSDPVLTAIYHFDDSDDIKIDFVSAGDDKCYIFKDDVYTGGIVDMSRLTGKNSTQSFYNSFCERAGILRTVRSNPLAEEY